MHMASGSRATCFKVDSYFFFVRILNFKHFFTRQTSNYHAIVHTALSLSLSALSRPTITAYDRTEFIKKSMYFQSLSVPFPFPVVVIQ